VTIGFRIGAATDVGVQREINQDSYSVSGNVAVVADGMGGHRGGEVASSLAAQEMVSRFAQPDLALLVEAVEHSNRRILDAAAANPMLHGMGTTVVALGLINVPDGVSLGAINVGDSRMYRLTGVVLEQLTEDHSLVEALVREGRLTPEQAEVHPQRNIVTRALGVVEHVEVDSFHFIPKVGDRYLLCSDGLFNEVNAQEIATILATYADPQETADALVVAANAGGGRDNITTVVVDIVDEAESHMPAAPVALASSANIDGPASPSAPDPSDDAVTFDTPHSASEPTTDDQQPGESPAGEKQRWSWRR
jgi:protein phosphatase